MYVKTVNYNLPDEEGNVNIQMLEGPTGDQGIQGPRGIQGMQGEQGPRGEKGPPGVLFHDLTNVKCFLGKTTTTDGNFTLNISEADFQEVLYVFPSLQSTDHSQAEQPLGVNFKDLTTNNITGKAFCVTSAGLLAAMQQTEVKDGTIVHVMVIGR